ncbi:hypothetical protein FC21_GL000909 [Limosilactobacillus equigenerosi DSM 18793 = JCM 14505]|uniref:Uncharacterized protein n=2 Tax=Limosilactobacillus TaxID=2742598 RepID=A0A0R1UTJ7_9LACO|nr:hypothetical protein FC21_GL000909 [Limosilactobacillus equigenerosi DSM 18793 = JCM 14505]
MNKSKTVTNVTKFLNNLLPRLIRVNGYGNLSGLIKKNKADGRKLSANQFKSLSLEKRREYVLNSFIQVINDLNGNDSNLIVKWVLWDTDKPIPFTRKTLSNLYEWMGYDNQSKFTKDRNDAFYLFATELSRYSIDLRISAD